MSIFNPALQINVTNPPTATFTASRSGSNGIVTVETIVEGTVYKGLRVVANGYPTFQITTVDGNSCTAKNYFGDFKGKIEATTLYVESPLSGVIPNGADIWMFGTIRTISAPISANSETGIGTYTLTSGTGNFSGWMTALNGYTSIPSGTTMVGSIPACSPGSEDNTLALNFIGFAGAYLEKSLYFPSGTWLADLSSIKTAYSKDSTGAILNFPDVYGANSTTTIITQYPQNIVSRFVSGHIEDLRLNGSYIYNGREIKNCYFYMQDKQCSFTANTSNGTLTLINLDSGSPILQTSISNRRYTEMLGDTAIFTGNTSNSHLTISSPITANQISRTALYVNDKIYDGNTYIGSITSVVDSNTYGFSSSATYTSRELNCIGTCYLDLTAADTGNGSNGTYTAYESSAGATKMLREISESSMYIPYINTDLYSRFFKHSTNTDISIKNSTFDIAGCYIPIELADAKTIDISGNKFPYRSNTEISSSHNVSTHVMRVYTDGGVTESINFTKNMIHAKAVTSIFFGSNRSNLTRDVVVEYNDVKNNEEEALAFDGFGNNAGLCPVICNGELHTLSNDTYGRLVVTLDKMVYANTTSSVAYMTVSARSNWKNYYFAFSLNTNIDGTMVEIVDFDSSNNTLTLDTTISAETINTGVGTLAGVHSGFFGGSIRFNRVTESSKTGLNISGTYSTGISIYLNVFNMDIRNNIISNQGCGIAITGGYMMGAVHTLAYNNTVENNMLACNTNIILKSLYSGIPQLGNKINNNSCSEGDILLQSPGVFSLQNNELIGNAKIIHRSEYASSPNYP